MDKDSDVIRTPGSNSVQGEDRTLSIAVDGWENSKMKKKRTGIKQENAASSITTKAVDGYREPKQGTHPRLLPEARSRLADSYGFRYNVTYLFSVDDSALKTKRVSKFLVLHCLSGG